MLWRQDVLCHPVRGPLKLSKKWFRILPAPLLRDIGHSTVCFTQVLGLSKWHKILHTCTHFFTEKWNFSKNESDDETTTFAGVNLKTILLCFGCKCQIEESKTGTVWVRALSNSAAFHFLSHFFFPFEVKLGSECVCLSFCLFFRSTKTKLFVWGYTPIFGELLY